MASLTPMMQQYLEIKEQYKDCILFFRLGDFYEMFFSDAEVASRELEITLTGKDCGLEERAPMCGVPFHSADSYIAKLISKGYKVAICEQIEDPALAKGLVKRDVIRIVTPGTVTDSAMLDEKKNNYLMSIYKNKNYYGIACVDLTTGEFLSTHITFGNTFNKLMDEIAKFSPSEIVVNGEFFHDENIKKTLKQRFDVYISGLEDKFFEKEFSIQKVRNYFKDYVIEENAFDLYINASGALLEYLEQTQKVNLSHIQNFNVYRIEEYMILDMATRRNLELTETMREKNRKGSLLWVLDRTMTSMGGRTLRKWIEQPLINLHDIKDRLDAVNEFKERFMIRSEVRELLRAVYDIERLMTKVILGSANCRDLISIKHSIGQVPYIKELLRDLKADLNVLSYNELDTLTDVYEIIDKAIVDDPPVAVKEGGIIKEGFNEEVDRLRSASKDGKKWIAHLESKERERTGIKNLKVGFNKVFGYYIEVTKSYYSQVPDDYIRKQTLANCERYITPELKEIENTVLGAEDRLVELEYQIFVDVRNKVAKEINRLKTTARSLARIDVLCSLAEVADRESYTMPEVTDDDKIEIKDGRHPVVEKIIGQEAFVPNDTYLDMDENQIAIITGPNMAGKSTYMRQVALIVLMAQIGSFVPAKSAKIGIVDRIFTRVGASDDLAAGQSTFMVEMSEVANILGNATSKSLLVLDEIGRGTSTYDGLSIAWAVIEYIGEKIGARTLFATHYHELTELEERIEGIKNYCISVEEKGEDIIFLRKILRGGADNSYGVQVARLAGIPDPVIHRAKEILKKLEDADITRKEKRITRRKQPIEGQIDVFTFNAAQRSYDEVLNELKSLDITTLTPLDAINVLYNLQKKVKG
ncbi:MAG TPA: DNA mismatch repair protein MutS [Hungateiclostridium thermocellum]|jgi:DNA mismatch repair protein MutS|uniref:DNA mismatch repair protein MutS n=2 Tax=Acetivibrio thermocellus TaxID=1515 RepID=MUTS_ACET2|nr:DNA mismatch repair protein MutS [Acetivibrio thermocellus]A3DDI3.1 RecName: Full=DNA mismatch repair protein MutS [Acetivibrio thermocellus ATCC 27405]CDG35472.1 DNA mismatch repair protein MutS [Acetivibrio thermocellus BC1]ABN52012.1 DNA mismatch repair protein MutS [Acetivibrio thermocellus ATCC 27405]ADU74507.1 DNA mismatch repair protein MutS [Acetivibrio thermocellus DSM 1313]ALX08450.1 DNA mismatch repair protein mutS [Acetivibrio thermocellus AD2]ANV76199.1 DNA mismatch repair pro